VREPTPVLVRLPQNGVAHESDPDFTAQTIDGTGCLSVCSRPGHSSNLGTNNGGFWIWAHRGLGSSLGIRVRYVIRTRTMMLRMGQHSPSAVGAIAD